MKPLSLLFFIAGCVVSYLSVRNTVESQPCWIYCRMFSSSSGAYHGGHRSTNFQCNHHEVYEVLFFLQKSSIVLSLIKLCSSFGPPRTIFSFSLHHEACEVIHFAHNYSINSSGVKVCLGLWACSPCRTISRSRNLFTSLPRLKGPFAIQAYTLVSWMEWCAWPKCILL